MLLSQNGDCSSFDARYIERGIGRNHSAVGSGPQETCDGSLFAKRRVFLPPEQSRNPSNVTRCAMNLIVVARSRIATFARLREQFAEEPNVRVMWDRRAQERREKTDDRVSERRTQERRRVVKPFEGEDYIVVHVTDDPMDAADNLTRSI